MMESDTPMGETGKDIKGLGSQMDNDSDKGFTLAQVSTGMAPSTRPNTADNHISEDPELEAYLSEMSIKHPECYDAENSEQAQNTNEDIKPSNPPELPADNFSRNQFLDSDRNQEARAKSRDIVDRQDSSHASSLQQARASPVQRNLDTNGVASRRILRPHSRRVQFRHSRPVDSYRPDRGNPHNNRRADHYSPDREIPYENRRADQYRPDRENPHDNPPLDYHGSGQQGRHSLFLPTASGNLLGMAGADVNRSNKRRRDDEDDQHYGRHDRRGAQRRRHENGPPRPRYEEPPFAKLRRLILNIASSTQLPQDEAIEIAKYLGEHFDDEELRASFFDVFIKLILEQPFKIPFVAAVAFYGNDVKPEITTEALKYVGDRAQEALKAGKWRDFKLLLRCLACLQPVYQDDGIFTLLGQLFDTVVDLQSANENDVVGIELVKIILLTLPYALVSGGDRFHEQAQQILRNTGIVASNMIPMEGLIHSYVGQAEELPMGYHSVIGLLQVQLTSESESGWTLACIPRFDPEALRRAGGDESLPTVPPTHAFPSIAIPSPVNPGPEPLFPEAYFSLFAAGQDVESVPKVTDIAASLIRDAIADTIDQLDFNREAVAKFMVDLDCYWSTHTFAKRGINLDKLNETRGDKIQHKSEDMVIDAIFSQLFKLPNPQHKLVYYHSLITQCCKVAPAAIAPSLGRGIRTIYRNLHVIDLELAYRFVDWFSHHLSNFEFRWRWAEWLTDLSLPNLHPKKATIIATLDKEIRLSFAKRIRSTLPEEMHTLIPERLDEDQSPEFKYDNPQTPFAAEGQALLKEIRKKAPAEEIQQTIDKIHTDAAELGITEVLVPSTDAFVTAICRLGSKSLSHVLSCIERGKDRLLEIAQNEVARRQIVASVVEYWKDQPGVAVRIIDILLNYTILAPMTVVQWVFGSHMGAGETLAESWVFEMVSNTVAKVTNRNRQIASARLQKGLPADQLEMVEATLAKDRDNAREIFKYIEDMTRGVSEGSADRLIEKLTSGELSQEEGLLIQAWGKRWHAVFLRKAQVEESVVGEEAVEAKIKLLAALPDAADQTVDMEDGNGVAVPAADGKAEVEMAEVDV